MKILNIVGARPNFMKIAPLMKEMNRYDDMHPVLVHTGQHYDAAMSKLFFEELGIPKPHINLEVGSASHAKQTALIMQRIEPILLQEQPDILLVVGDVNSTIACALTAVKMGIPVAHVEAGLRSFDRSMPEEINRVLTDAISDYLFTTERSANENLKNEGVPENKIYFVGNVMIDTLYQHLDRAKSSLIRKRLGLDELQYGVVTVHRPSNVDHRETLMNIFEALNQISQEIPIIFPCHPRTRERIYHFGLMHYICEMHDGVKKGGIYLQEPLGYLDFLKLLSEAKIVFTDSGGIQEETTILGVPCLTLRKNTERPVTIEEGTNVIVGVDVTRIVQEAYRVLNRTEISKHMPELWDGKAATRIIEILKSKRSCP